NVKVIDDLKLRASYGELGGDAVGANQFINNYAFNNQYTLGSIVYQGLDLLKLARPNITWEVTKKPATDLNAVFLKNISFEFIYFKENRSNILLPRNASIPNVTGIVNPYDADPLVPSENIGRVDNKGFESTLGYFRPGDFSY